MGGQECLPLSMDVLKLITYLERQCLKTGVNVYLNTEFTLKDAKKDYDKVILSAGSSPMMPPIPGIEKQVCK